MKFRDCLEHLDRGGIIKFVDEHRHAYYKFLMRSYGAKIFVVSDDPKFNKWDAAYSTFADSYINNYDDFELIETETREFEVECE